MTAKDMNRRTFLWSAGLLATGFAAGQVARGGGVLAEDATPDATATRDAEIDELHALQTQVAEPTVCAPEPTETPVPTATIVPPIPAGTPVAFDSIWTATVFGIGPATPGTEVPAGKFMQVNLALSHSSDKPELPPIYEMQLLDDQGRRTTVDQAVNRKLLGVGNIFTIPVGVEENRAIVFDVAADAGDSYILELPRDPSFRIGLTVEVRG